MRANTFYAMRLLRLGLMVLLVLCAISVCRPGWAQPVAPPPIELVNLPLCPTEWLWSPTEKQCELKVKKTCDAQALEFKDGQCTPRQPPRCADPDYVVNNAGKCVRRPFESKSSPGDYAGDCFRLHTTPEGTNLVADKSYLVLSQNQRDGDPLLALVEAEDKGWFSWSCQPKKGSAADRTQRYARASQMIGAGAVRSGWSYGMLAIPYKYHLDDKSFSSGVSVGPFLGRRVDAWGASYTLAVTAALGSVQGSVTDAAGQQSTPTLAAFTMAGGVMFDVSKGAKPFKAGVFIGRDVVGSDKAVAYKHDRRTWFALQIGFDFTDN